MIFNHILKHFDGSIGDGRALNFHAGNRRGTELAQRGVVKSHYLNLSGNLKSELLHLLHGNTGQFIVAPKYGIHWIFSDVAFYLERPLPGRGIQL